MGVRMRVFRSLLIRMLLILLNRDSVLMTSCMLSWFSRIRLSTTSWSVAHQAPLSIGFSRQKYWSGLPCPPPGDLPDPGSEPVSPALAGRFYTASTTWELMTAFNLNHFHQGHTSRYNYIGKVRAFIHEFSGDTL